MIYTFLRISLRFCSSLSSFPLALPFLNFMFLFSKLLLLMFFNVGVVGIVVVDAAAAVESFLHLCKIQPFTCRFQGGGEPCVCVCAPAALVLGPA